MITAADGGARKREKPPCVQSASFSPRQPPPACCRERVRRPRIHVLHLAHGVRRAGNRDVDRLGRLRPVGHRHQHARFSHRGPVTVGVASSQGVLNCLDEGSGYTGDFAPGDHLLVDGGSESDSFIVSFTSPVRGFGMQIEPHYLTGSWSGTMDVFDSGNNLLASVVLGGTKGSAEDNSAPFYGVLSSVADISYMYFLVDQSSLSLPPAGAVAINTMDVLSAVPESSSLSLMATVLLGLGGLSCAAAVRPAWCRAGPSRPRRRGPWPGAARRRIPVPAGTP